MSRPLVPPFRRRKASRENQDQRAFVKALNLRKLGYFWRVKTTGTFDPAKKIFRRDPQAVAGIPDICGYLNDGRAIFIECKFVADVDRKRKLVFATKATLEQREFLRLAQESKCVAGIAFTLEDAIAIAEEDSVRWPRHPRTYQFMPIPWQETYAEAYALQRAALAQANRDPVLRAVYLINKNADPETWKP